MYFRTFSHFLSDTQNEVICLVDRAMFNSRIFDTISFILLYLIPLSVISGLYLRIARFLWVNNVRQENAIRKSTVKPVTSTNSETSLSFISIQAQKEPSGESFKDVKKTHSIFESKKLKSYHEDIPQLRCHRGTSTKSWKVKSNTEPQPSSFHSKDVIRRWQKVVKLLVAVVICFAVCNLPYHLRKMLIYYYSGYKTTTNAALIATPLTQVLTYLNSALNPVLYCFMSDRFRFCISEVLGCEYNWRGRRRRIGKRGFGGRRPPPSTQILQMESIKYKRDKNVSFNASQEERF